MKTRRKEFLSDFVVDQYPIEKYWELITITLDIVENFLAVLEEGFNYDSTSIISYEEKYGSTQRSCKSKIESLYISNERNEGVMNNFLSVYYNAYNSLNLDEKKMFDATFINKMTDLEIIDKYNEYSLHIRKVRKSAIVRFSLRCGLDKFVDLVN